MFRLKTFYRDHRERASSTFEIKNYGELGVMDIFHEKGKFSVIHYYGMESIDGYVNRVEIIYRFHVFGLYHIRGG